MVFIIAYHLNYTTEYFNNYQQFRDKISAIFNVKTLNFK